MAKIAVYKSDGTHVFTYDINLRGLDHAPKETEAYEDARRCALEDGLVSEAEAKKLIFKVEG